ncbi:MULTISPECIES: hypothetical protein [Cytobacillus]|uniref:hypothetical protein n=1 Tax=Cytobacillus TaxID=2675230 RepID=UPI00203EEA77|nr:hypothetical protein [Cytobacillus firmus]MCM3706973.1 hypothetical protein [Cytobacillus firmus]
MITFSYLTIFLLLAILSTIFDMRLFNYTFFEALRNLFSEIATGRMIIIFTILIGLASSTVADFRLLKAKKKKRPS